MMYYLMIEKNEEPYYLVHAGDNGCERVWTTELEEAVCFHNSDAAEHCNRTGCDERGTVVRMGDEEQEEFLDDNDMDWI